MKNVKEITEGTRIQNLAIAGTIRGNSYEKLNEE